LLNAHHLPAPFSHDIFFLTEGNEVPSWSCLLTPPEGCCYQLSGRLKPVCGQEIRNCHQTLAILSFSYLASY
jgi:hypothetical protein